MPIKFGDSLENQNANYPIVDLIGNHAKGLQYVSTFNTATLEGIPQAKRGQGSVVIEKGSGSAYVYTNGAGISDEYWGDLANWQPLGEATQTTDLLVTIPGTQSFGKYVNGNTITIGSGGWNALEIIRDAISGFQNPTVSFGGSQLSAIPFTLSVQNINTSVSINVTNQNQRAIQNGSDAYKIYEVRVRRRLVSNNTSQTWSDYLGSSENTYTASTATGGVATFFNNLNATIGATGTPVSHSVQLLIAEFNHPAQSNTATTTADYYYAVEVRQNGADGLPTGTFTYIYNTGQNNTGYQPVADYSAPSATITITRTSGLPNPSVVNSSGSSVTLNNINRLVGDYGSTVTFTVTNNTPTVPLTQYAIERSLNGLTFGTIVGPTAYTSGTISYTENATGVLATTNNVDTIAYRVLLYSNMAAATTSTPSGNTITYYYLSYVGKSSVDNNPTTAARADGIQYSGLVNLTESNIEGFNTRVLAATHGSLHQITGTSTGAITLSTAAGEFLYVAIPVTTGNANTATSEITNINRLNNANEITAWCTSDPTHANSLVFDAAFANNVVSITNIYGNTRDYYVYRTRGVNAYSVSSTLFIW